MQARWEGNGNFYDAVISTAAADESVFSVIFEDGDTQCFIPKSDLRAVQASKDVVPSFVAGVRVARRRGWQWSDCDGGFGSGGTLIEIEKEDDGVYGKVRWDSGREDWYACGGDCGYDLAVVVPSEADRLSLAPERQERRARTRGRRTVIESDSEGSSEDR